MNIGIIYIGKNKINGKIYIGQTWKSLKSRIGHHYRCRDIMIISRALNKYGKDNFEWEILDKADSQKELDELEILYIKKFNSTNKTIGYNIMSGGNVGKHSRKTKLQISRAKGGKPFLDIKLRN